MERTANTESSDILSGLSFSFSFHQSTIQHHQLNNTSFTIELSLLDRHHYLLIQQQRQQLTSPDQTSQLSSLNSTSLFPHLPTTTISTIAHSLALSILISTLINHTHPYHLHTSNNETRNHIASHNSLITRANKYTPIPLSPLLLTILITNPGIKHHCL